MQFLALGVGLILLWFWMRSEVIRRGGWRVGAGLLSVVLVIVGAVLSFRGDWEIGLPVVLAGLGSAATGRLNRGPKPQARAPAAPPGMSAAEARAILGVGADATADEIRAAYRRLMPRAHPDTGGTEGMAAQLNAARYRLLRG
jgi:hypothetical protein